MYRYIPKKWRSLTQQKNGNLQALQIILDQSTQLSMKPPILAFGTIRRKLPQIFISSIYDPLSQKTDYPLGMGSQKEFTTTNRNIGTVDKPIWKLLKKDDATEK